MSARRDDLRATILQRAARDPEFADAALLAGIDLLLVDGAARCGGSERRDELAALAVEAKTRMKLRSNGWSQIGKRHMAALCFFADLLFTDTDLNLPKPGGKSPTAL